jgi:ribonuclease P protein component
MIRPMIIMLGRLRSSAEFGRVRREGSYWGGRRCGVSAARKPATQESGSGSRVGYITSKRVGGAVQRNRARRLLRESIRSMAAQIEPDWDIVVIAQSAISAPGVRLQDVRDELQWLLKKAQLMRKS